MEESKRTIDELLVEDPLVCEPPKIESYRTEDILELLGPANTCSGFATCASFSGAVVDC
jgi:hypothetical protein